ncbi:MAG: hypothetical protein AB7O97_19945 [Planctomycetota bacterium]
MRSIPSVRWLTGASAGALFLLLSGPEVAAQTLVKTLTYTRWAESPNVKQCVLTYNAGAGTLAIVSTSTITHTLGADGILFAPDGDLIVGGQGDRTHKVQVSTGSFTTVNAGGAQSYHVMLDPSGTKVWTAGNLGPLASVPLYPFANGTQHPLTGDDTQVTHISFVNGEAFYTASTPLGTGHFGVIDLETFTTTRIYSNVLWAHGMAYDCYTGDLVVFGGSYVAQIDPSTRALVSTLDASALNLLLDQGTSDGEGHLYIASNTGYMLFVDMTLTGIVGTPDFVDAVFLDTFLDDIAPDCGLGAPPTCPHTQGYWKNHASAWPVTSLTLGCTNYTQLQCLALFQTPVRGDASINLAHQLMAAKLSVADNASNWPAIGPTIEAADALLCTFAGSLPYGVASSTATGQQMVYLAQVLDGFNNGLMSPGCAQTVQLQRTKR